MKLTKSEIAARRVEMSAAADELNVPDAWREALISAMSSKAPLRGDSASRVRRAFALAPS